MVSMFVRALLPLLRASERAKERSNVMMNRGRKVVVEKQAVRFQKMGLAKAERASRE